MVLGLELAVEQGLELMVQPVQVQEWRLALLVPAVEPVQVQQERQERRLEQERQVRQEQLVLEQAQLLAYHRVLHESY